MAEAAMAGAQVVAMEVVVKAVATVAAEKEGVATAAEVMVEGMAVAQSTP